MLSLVVVDGDDSLVVGHGLLLLQTMSLEEPQASVVVGLVALLHEESSQFGG